jgi:hypothetical protein
MRGSKLGIAAQAIGVLALIAIVYGAFLRPDDPDPLTGIEIEDGAALEAAPFVGGERRRGRSNGPARVAKRSRGPATVAESELGVEHVDTIAADTPAAAQYSGGVARILDQVARARP